MRKCCRAIDVYSLYFTADGVGRRVGFSDGRDLHFHFLNRRSSVGQPSAAAAAAVGLVVWQWSGRSVMTVLLIFTPAVAVDEWALVACGDDVDGDRRAAGLERFWSTFDVLAGSGGLLMFVGGRGAIVDVLFA